MDRYMAMRDAPSFKYSREGKCECRRQPLSGWMSAALMLQSRNLESFEVSDSLSLICQVGELRGARLLSLFSLSEPREFIVLEFVLLSPIACM